ncbi:MAG: M48 family metalloprotease [Vicinamibacteria bacterium]|nr:M48 family metalloprotease [Vicinamibacteria bacterium]
MKIADAGKYVSILSLGVLVACATNPATGKRQLMLVSEGQEALMGKEADAQFHALYGDFSDRGVQAYVESVARPLAAVSERPDLPWTFRVIDDPQVNAFALPGGYIYVTRGILAHMNSEAELAGVLGHEIGHVTARHSASSQSKQLLGALGLGVGMILSPTLRQGGEALSSAFGLVFLKFGRDQESQADRLGLRYLVRKDYKPEEMLDVFRMLDGVTNAADGDRIPNWLSTHPAPPNRISDMTRIIAEQGSSGTRVGRAEFISKLDGLDFGPNPREGFFREQVFYHPDMAFKMTFPVEWATENEKQGVSSMPSAKDAIVQLTLAQGEPQAAATEFARQQGVQAGSVERGDVNGFPAASIEFEIQDEKNGPLQGMVTFVKHGGRTLQLLGYSTRTRYGAYRSTFTSWIRSYQRLTDPRILAAQPLRLKIETVRSATTIADLSRAWKSPVKVETLALINAVEINQTIPAGTLVKRVVGEIIQ